VAVRAVRRAGVGAGGGTKRNGDAMSTTATNVKERPILFSAPMVRAILDGRKSCTRRIVKPQPGPDIDPARLRACQPTIRGRYRFMGNESLTPRCEISIRPFAFVGQRLWVKEAWQITSRLGTEYSVWYPAGGEAVGIDVGFEGPDPKWDAMIHEDRVRNPLFMPRWASRITLEVTGVRVERLHEISDDDAKAEGAEAVHLTAAEWMGNAKIPTRKVGRNRSTVDPHVIGFMRRWHEINGVESWNENPWVWCVSFKRVKVPR
jgi:hypothetical protein